MLRELSARLGELIGSSSATSHHKHEFFSSYDECLSRCTSDGFENKQLIDLVRRKTIAYQHELESLGSEPFLFHREAALVASVMSCRGDKISVLDLGGGLGAHYFLLRRLLPPSVRLQWVVVETNALVQLSGEFSGEELHFVTEIEMAAQELGAVDIAIASGVLQCVRDPIQTLNRLLMVRAKQLALLRLAFVEGNDVLICKQHSRLADQDPATMVYLEHNAAISYPFTFTPHRAFNDLLRKDYSVLAKFEDVSGLLNVQRENILGYGLLAELKVN